MSATNYYEGRFPPQNLDWPRLLPLVGPANAAVARYEGVLHGIPNADVLLSPLTSQEAVLSSRIEGTQATLGEVLEFEAAEDTASGEKRDDILEVLNYRRAMRHAVSALERLLAVSRDDDWTGWCVFFLGALTEQARDNEARAKAILALYQARKDWITAHVHSRYAIRALDWFFSRPIFKVSDFIAAAGIPEASAKRIVRLAREHGLLREIRAGAGRRPAIFAFPDLLNVAEGRQVF